jgi:hypothetical protein
MYNDQLIASLSKRVHFRGINFHGDAMGYTVYSIAIAAGKRFVGITTDFHSRVSRDLADAACDAPRTWHGAAMKAEGIQTQQAFRVVHVSPELKDAVKHQEETIQLFIDEFGPAWYKQMPRGYTSEDDGGVNEERLDYTVYKCSGCRYLSTVLSKVQAHFKMKAGCAHQIVVNFQAHIIVPVDVPVDTLEAAMATRVPSGLSSMDQWGIDKRMEYLLSSPKVLSACFDAVRLDDYTGVDISLKIFMHLWGSKAPRRFQTVFTYNHTMYDLRGVGDPLDPTTVDLAVIGFNMDPATAYLNTIDINKFTVNLCTALDKLAAATSANALRVGEHVAAVAGKYRELLQPLEDDDYHMSRMPRYLKRLRKEDPSRVKFASWTWALLEKAVSAVVKKTLLVKAKPA